MSERPPVAQDATRPTSRSQRRAAAPRAAVALASALLLLLTAAAVLFAWQSYREALRFAEMRAESAAEIVGVDVRWLGEVAFQALRRVDESLRTRGAPEPGGARGIGDLHEIVASLPPGVAIWVADADGDPVLTTELGTSGTSGIDGNNIAEQPYFLALRDGERWHFSSLITTPRSQRQVFVIGKRLERAGAFAGAAVLVVPATLLGDFWANLDLGPGSTVSLVRNDGMLMARHPLPESGIDLSGHELFAKHLPAAPAGRYRSGGSPIDGVSRFVGYYSVPGLPLVAVASVAEDAALRDFWSGLTAVAVLAVPVGLALIAVLVWVALLLSRYERQRQALAAAAEQNRMLLGEIHHRVKNNLQTVTALVQMQAMPEEAKRQVTARIAAMTAVHEHMYSSDEFGSVDLRGYLERLAQQLGESHSGEVAVRFEAASVELDAERATPLGLIVNEAVTNAFKHGYRDGSMGQVRIGVASTPEGSLLLEVADDGVGFDPATAGSKMGSRLIAGLCRQLGAEHRYESGAGTRFVLVFPVQAADCEAAASP